MKPADNIEQMVKKLNDSTSAKMDERVLGDVLQALEQSQKAITPKRRLIMKSSVIKLAAAAAIIIFTVLIGLNPFGTSKTNVLWADVVEHFESVPFFNVTIYIGNDTSAQTKKIEIWKSGDSRIRAHEENRVIFADFTGEKNKITALDRATGKPIEIDAGSLAKIFLDILCPKGEFSLDTLIQSFPSHATGMTPVETPENAATKETVVFEVKSNTTPEHLIIHALHESKLPVRICFRDPRTGEYGDFIFDYSEQKDPAFFDLNAFAKE